MKTLRPTTIFVAALLVLCAVSLADAAVRDAVRWNNFGGELVKQGKLEEALTNFQQAMALDPTFAAAQLNLAYTLDRLGRADEAIEAYQKAIALDPQSGNAYNNLGVLYMNKGNNDEAAKAFEEGLRVDPSNTNLQKNLENVKKNQGVLKERGSQVEKALKQAEAKPDDPRLAFEAARILAFYGQNSEALDWLEKAAGLGYFDIGAAKSDPVFVTLRSDPRFGRILEPR